MAANKYKDSNPTISELNKDMDDYLVKFYACLHYIHYEVSNKVLANAVKLWARANPDYDTSVLTYVGEPYLASVGKFCYMLNRGAILTDEHLKTVIDGVNGLIDRGTVAKAVAKEKALYTPPEEPVSKEKTEDNLVRQTTDYCGRLDEIVDDYVFGVTSKLNINITDYFKSTPMKPAHYGIVESLYLNEVDSLTVELASMGRPEAARAKKVLAFYGDIIEVANVLKVASRTTRGNAPIDRVKRTSRLKFLKRCDIMNMTSESDPAKIIGASKLWIYNTKTKKIGVYVGIDSLDGLDVSGSMIKNFTDDSVEKMVLGSAKFNAKKFQDGTDSEREKTFSKVKAMDTKLNGRFNEHIIILKVEK